MMNILHSTLACTLLHTGLLTRIICRQTLYFIFHHFIDNCLLLLFITSISFHKQLVLRLNNKSKLIAACGKLYGTAHVALPSNQTGNKHFVCSLSGSQLMWQIYFYLPVPTGKILYQNPIPNFIGLAWVLFFDFWTIFGFNIIQLYCNCKMWFFKTQCNASSSTGIAYVHIILFYSVLNRERLRLELW